MKCKCGGNLSISTRIEKTYTVHENGHTTISFENIQAHDICNTYFELTFTRCDSCIEAHKFFKVNKYVIEPR